MPTPITRKFIQQSLLGNNLGPQTTPSSGSVADDRDGDAIDGGKFRHFTGGSIYWRSNLGAWEIHGSIMDRFRDLGFERNAEVGFPISDERPGIAHPNNRFSEFEHGVLYWTQATGVVQLLRPVTISRVLVETTVSSVIQQSLSTTMVGGIRLVGNIAARIAAVLPYQCRQLDYPQGGRPFTVFTNRCYRITFDINFTGTQQGTMHCTIALEFKTNPIGQLVFFLRDFQFSFEDFGQQLLSLCIGGTINDQVLPMCNVEKVVEFPPLPAIPSGARFLAAHLNTPTLGGRGNPRDLLLFIEP